MSKVIEYNNLVAFHPGSYVEEAIDNLNITQREFADKLAVSAKTVSQLVNGESNISPAIADKLAKVTGISMRTWLNLQANYETKLAEINDLKNLDKMKPIVELIDFTYLKRHHVIEDKRYSMIEKIQVLQHVLKLSDLTQLSEFNTAVSYRRSASGDRDKAIVCSNVMLELATDMARNVTQNKYNHAKLTAALPTIRQMVAHNPSDVYEELQQTLLDCGIVLEALPNLRGARLNGATKQFKNGSILLLVTDKNKFTDIFWFSFAHELGHIYYDDTRSLTNSKHDYQTKERRADEFAANFLIPQREFHDFVYAGTFTEQSILNFADQHDIDAGLVVGRLQSMHKVGYEQFNYLKNKYAIGLH